MGRNTSGQTHCKGMRQAGAASARWQDSLTRVSPGWHLASAAMLPLGAVLEAYPSGSVTALSLPVCEPQPGWAQQFVSGLCQQLRVTAGRRTNTHLWCRCGCLAGRARLQSSRSQCVQCHKSGTFLHARSAGSLVGGLWEGTHSCTPHLRCWARRVRSHSHTPRWHHPRTTCGSWSCRSTMPRG